jgi:hypothetical protein
MKAQPWRERREEYLRETGRYREAQVIPFETLQRAHEQKRQAFDSAEESANNKERDRV